MMTLTVHNPDGSSCTYQIDDNKNIVGRNNEPLPGKEEEFNLAMFGYDPAELTFRNGLYDPLWDCYPIYEDEFLEITVDGDYLIAQAPNSWYDEPLLEAVDDPAEWDK